MDLEKLPLLFNRALLLTFSKRKCLLVFLVLVLCGILMTFFHAVMIDAGEWLTMSLVFLPLFICSGVLLCTGIVLTRVYHHEIKQKSLSYKETIGNSLELLMGASFFSIPIILIYLVMWLVLGLFFLLKEIPGFGLVFGVIFAFAPFILNLATLLLFVGNVAMLFYITPIMALKGIGGQDAFQILSKRFKTDIFSHLLLAFIALLPISFILGLLFMAVWMSEPICSVCRTPISYALQWFFIMIPFAAGLTPVVIFFFNFAAESHILLHKK